MEQIEITKNSMERLRLIEGGMAFVLIHELYPDGFTHVMTLSPREARALRNELDIRLPEMEKRAGLRL